MVKIVFISTYLMTGYRNKKYYFMFRNWILSKVAQGVLIDNVRVIIIYYGGRAIQTFLKTIIGIDYNCKNFQG